MTAELSLNQRLQQIYPLMQSDAFLEQRGIGNEIGYHIFDYAPQEEGIVREYVHKTLLPKRSSVFPFLAVDLFELMLKMLHDQGYLEGAADLEASDGSLALLEGLRDFLNPAEITSALKEQLAPQDLFVVLYGVGQAWPVIRTHELLNNMHAQIDRIPVVMFYPGHYDEEQLQLFDKFKDENYYRAFQLVPRTEYSTWRPS